MNEWVVSSRASELGDVSQRPQGECSFWETLLIILLSFLFPTGPCAFRMTVSLVSLIPCPAPFSLFFHSNFWFSTWDVA